MSRSVCPKTCRHIARMADYETLCQILVDRLEPGTVEPLLYDHPQNHIGVVV